jgi:O-Methyltransferase involved in polyketide biosynthesis
VLKIVKQNLKGVSETQLITLWARAAETKHENPIIKDKKAIEIVNEIEYDFSKFDKDHLTQVMVAVRTEILDNATNAFIEKYPDAVIINLGCGLDTRFSRLDNGKINWYDLDLSESIKVRKNFFEETDRYKMIAKSVFDYSWTDEIVRDSKPVLIILEGLLVYFKEQEVKKLLNKLINTFEGSEILSTIIPPFVIEKIAKKGVFSEMGVEFKWGMKSGREMEKYSSKIKFIEEWIFMDYHQHRWEMFEWSPLIPKFKNEFSNRIIHLKFK